MDERGPESKLVKAGEEPAIGLEQETTSESSVKNREALAEVARLVEQIHSSSRRALESPIEHTTLLNAVHSLAELSQQGDQVDQVVRGGAADALIPLLTLFAGRPTNPANRSGEMIEQEACLILGRLASFTAHRQAIDDRGALPGLVGLLNRYLPFTSPPNAGALVVRRAADALYSLANRAAILTHVGYEGVIPRLVALLDSYELEVQRASAAALRMLAFTKHNTKKIVECGGLPTIIQLLRVEDLGINEEAVCLLQNLVLFGRGADTITKRGALPPLIEMLGAAEVELNKMAVSTLDCLAQFSADNRAGIVQAGGLAPLLLLLAKGDEHLQWEAGLLLFHLAENDDNIDAFIREGVVQCLQDCEVLYDKAKGRNFVYSAWTQDEGTWKPTRVEGSVGAKGWHFRVEFGTPTPKMHGWRLH